jgi:hypothetical protein
MNEPDGAKIEEAERLEEGKRIIMQIFDILN